MELESRLLPLEEMPRKRSPRRTKWVALALETVEMIQGHKAKFQQDVARCIDYGTAEKATMACDRIKALARSNRERYPLAARRDGTEVWIRIAAG